MYSPAGVVPGRGRALKVALTRFPRAMETAFRRRRVLRSRGCRVEMKPESAAVASMR
jgi:hypothetical protein